MYAIVTHFLTHQMGLTFCGTNRSQAVACIAGEKGEVQATLTSDFSGKRGDGFRENHQDVSRRFVVT